MEFIFLQLSRLGINFVKFAIDEEESVDPFATGKAIELYAAEMKRRIEQLEKSVKEKDEAIKKHKNRERALVAALVVFVALLFAIVFFLMMNAVYLGFNNPRH